MPWLTWLTCFWLTIVNCFNLAYLKIVIVIFLKAFLYVKKAKHLFAIGLDVSSKTI